MNYGRAMQDALSADRFRQWDELIHWLEVKILMRALTLYLLNLQIIILERQAGIRK